MIYGFVGFMTRMRYERPAAANLWHVSSAAAAGGSGVSSRHGARDLDTMHHADLSCGHFGTPHAIISLVQPTMNHRGISS